MVLSGFTAQFLGQVILCLTLGVPAGRLCSGRDTPAPPLLETREQSHSQVWHRQWMQARLQPAEPPCTRSESPDVQHIIQLELWVTLVCLRWVAGTQPCECVCLVAVVFRPDSFCFSKLCSFRRLLFCLKSRLNIGRMDTFNSWHFCHELRRQHWIHTF